MSSEPSFKNQHVQSGEAPADPLRVLQQQPVVVPGGARDRQRNLRPDVQTRRADRLVLGVAPPVPGALDRRIDERQPFRLVSAGGGRGKAQQLPLAVLAHDRDEGLAARPAGVPRRPWIFRIGGHEPLLHGEHEVLRGIERRGRERWIAAAEPDLQGPNRLAESERRLAFVVEPEHLDVVEQLVRLGEKDASSGLRHGGTIAQAVLRVKQSFTG